MRDNLLQDEVFLGVLAKGGNVKKIYESYTKAVRKSINQKIQAEEAMERDPSRIHADARGDDLTLGKKDMEYLKKTLGEINTLYKSDGSNQSDYMKHLTASLKRVIKNAAPAEGGQGQFTVKREDMDKLRKDAQTYYKKRQGLIFDPLTDRGKARLQVVENLVVKIDKMEKPKPMLAK